VHCPGIIFGVLGNIHDNLAQAATNTGFVNRTRKAFKAIPISELETKSALANTMKAGY
jgi:hypothetical protein